MDYTYQFEDHLREHRPSRLGQRLWWIPAAAGVGVAIADGIYLATTSAGQLSDTLAVALPFIAALLLLIASAALTIADWTYPMEKYYREAHHAASSKALAYILAGRQTRGELRRPEETGELRVSDLRRVYASGGPPNGAPTPVASAGHAAGDGS